MGRRRRRMGEVDRPDACLGARPVGQTRDHPKLDLAIRVARGDRDRHPEPAAVAVDLRILVGARVAFGCERLVRRDRGVQRAKDVQSRHPERRRPADGAIHGDPQLGDPLVTVTADARAEDRRVATGRQRRRRACLEACAQVRIRGSARRGTGLRHGCDRVVLEAQNSRRAAMFLADDRVRLFAHRPRQSTTSYARTRHRARSEPDSVVLAARRGRLDLPQLQPAARQGGEARGPRGAGARPPGRRDHGPRFLRKVREALARSRRGVVGCVGRDRRAQHRLVGGLGHVGIVHPPLPGDTAAESSRPSTWDRRGRPGVRRDRRGRHHRRLRDGAVAVGRAQLRFDESLGQLHGYDFDFCLRSARLARRS